MITWHILNYPVPASRVASIFPIYNPTYKKDRSDSAIRVRLSSVLLVKHIRVYLSEDEQFSFGVGKKAAEPVRVN